MYICTIPKCCSQVTVLYKNDMFKSYWKKETHFAEILLYLLKYTWKKYDKMIFDKIWNYLPFQILFKNQRVDLFSLKYCQKTVIFRESSRSACLFLFLLFSFDSGIDVTLSVISCRFTTCLGWAYLNLNFVNIMPKFTSIHIEDKKFYRQHCFGASWEHRVLVQTNFLSSMWIELCRANNQISTTAL